MSNVEIAYNHLLNWVVARGELPNDYAIKLLNLEKYCKSYFSGNNSIPSSIESIFVDIENEYTEWYDPISKAFEILKETDEGKKTNLLGQYTYEPMYNISKILKNFHRHNLHIVSYHQLLHKYATYYAPHLRKSIARVNSEVADCKFKETESARKLKNMTSELENKLKRFDIELSDYPFKEENQSLLYFKLQDKIKSNAIKFIKESYNTSSSLIKSLYPSLIDIVSAFVAFQRTSDVYSVEDSTKYFKFASEHGLESFALASSLNKSIEKLSTESDAATRNHSTTSDGITILNESYGNSLGNNVGISEEDYNFIFKTFLGSSLCRKLLLSDLYEMKIFLLVRADELKRSYSLPNYNLISDLDDTKKKLSLSECELYISKLTETIQLLTSKEMINMQNIIKSQQKLTDAVQHEMVLWTQCMNELAKQSAFQYKIKSLDTSLSLIKQELETVKNNAISIKHKLEKVVSTVSGTNVMIFGEIDNL
ncbi:conserved hypothetical protein [Theileria equi strain WA]|uniref:Uncharacterized protein n=1 Tax=Theileria equi strain WA TaxID=1537102 RepID=L1LEU2_THEEQ|nr:conserved hypothetical protein [Theileria equi strain WA]EKX73750.1 conserved hypothetical protein [Theileria equi strain WA]|eukprot:XP_004833202.1 conserved hypothetical protein [Theileria equi strain WA]